MSAYSKEFEVFMQSLPGFKRSGFSRSQALMVYEEACRNRAMEVLTVNKNLTKELETTKRQLEEALILLVMIYDSDRFNPDYFEKENIQRVKEFLNKLKNEGGGGDE